MIDAASSERDQVAGEDAREASGQDAGPDVGRTIEQEIGPVERECREHFNEPVIHGLGVARLIGYGATAVDQYYILHCPTKGVFWLSAVGGPTMLRGLRGQRAVTSWSGENWDDFFRLDTLLQLNGVPKAPSFIRDIRPDEDF